MGSTAPGRRRACLRRSRRAGPQPGSDRHRCRSVEVDAVGLGGDGPAGCPGLCAIPRSAVAGPRSPRRDVAHVGDAEVGVQRLRRAGAASPHRRARRKLGPRSPWAQALLVAKLPRAAASGGAERASSRPSGSRVTLTTAHARSAQSHRCLRASCRPEPGSTPTPPGSGGRAEAAGAAQPQHWPLALWLEVRHGAPWRIALLHRPPRAVFQPPGPGLEGRPGKSWLHDGQFNPRPERGPQGPVAGSSADSEGPTPSANAAATTALPSRSNDSNPCMCPGRAPRCVAGPGT
jgi:hypothetical protein